MSTFKTNKADVGNYIKKCVVYKLPT